MQRLFPFAGSRMLQDLLAAEGCKIGRRHIKTLVRRMGIAALYRRPRTTRSEPGHKIYPYRLRWMETRTRSGRWRAPISRWRAASSISRWCSGGCPRSPREAGPFQYRPGLAVHGRCVHRRARQSWHRHQHGRLGRLARQHVRRAVVAQRQLREGLSARPRHRVRRPRLDRPIPRLFTMAGVHTRALTAVLRIKLASTSCRSARQPNSGRSSTYRRGIAVQTTGATSSDATCPAPNSRLHAAQITAYSIKMLSQCHVKLFGSYPARLGGS
jgi:putative transposase